MTEQDAQHLVEQLVQDTWQNSQRLKLIPTDHLARYADPHMIRDAIFALTRVNGRILERRARGKAT